MSRHLRLFGLLALVGALASPASASPILRLEAPGTGTTLTLVDNGPGDLNPVLGAIGHVGTIGSFAVTVTGISKSLASNSPYNAFLGL